MNKKVRGNFVLDFGKYRGRTLKNVPRPYLNWCVKTFEDGPVRRAIKDFLARWPKKQTRPRRVSDPDAEMVNRMLNEAAENMAKAEMDDWNTDLDLAGHQVLDAEYAAIVGR